MDPTSFDRRQILASLAAIVASGPISSRALAASDGDQSLLAAGLAYLNTGTIGPCRCETVEETMRVWQELESVPLRFYGRSGAEEIAERTRNVAARFLGCAVDEMAITSSTTSGMNAIAQGLRLQRGDRVLVTDQEHSGGLHCWKYLERHHGVKVDTVTIRPGESDANVIVRDLAQKIRKTTRVISVSHVFSSTGMRTPVAEIAAMARAHGLLCVVDGAQAAGAIDVNLHALGCHAYATSGHKWLMGPKGTGLLYIAKDAQDRIRPMQFEESYNTYNNSNGVVNLPGILGLAKAIDYLGSVGIARVEEHNLSLRKKLREGISGINDMTIVGPATGPLIAPMLTCVLPERIDRTEFVKMLFDRHRLMIRATHKEFGFNGIRFSMHIFNTEHEIENAVRVMRAELGA